MTIARIVIASFTVLVVGKAFVGAQTIIEDQVRLTTPGAPWTIIIVGKALDLTKVQVKPDEKSAYFLMLDENDGLNISIFIEPVDKCKRAEECRDFVLNTGNPAWGKYQDLAKGKIGDYSYFEFFRPEVQGQPLRMQDMYAQYVANGYWVDLHISKVLYKKEDRLLFEKFISSIKFVPKTDVQAASSEKSIESIKKTADRWLSFWDAWKCRESYVSLTSISRNAVTEKQWIDYCEAAHKGLGTLKSRKLIATTLIKSMPGRPDYSGAQFRYQSVFENRPAIEFVSLTREKDGTWTVSNYLTM